MSTTAIFDKITVNFSDAFCAQQNVVVGEKIAFYEINTAVFAPQPVSIQHGKDGEVRKGDFDCEGTILVFHSQEDADYGSRLLKRNKNVIPLSKFEHSGETWGIMGSLDHYPDARWDLTRYAGVWIPDKDVYSNLTKYRGEARKQRIREYCQGVLESFNQYCNGDVYDYNLTVYNVLRDEDGDVITDEDDYGRNERIKHDSCGGFYGYEHVTEELESVLNYLLRKG
jgi:hypothetical protein